MNYPNLQYPNKRYSLLNSNGVAGIKEAYFEEDHKPTICGEHVVLACMVNDLVVDPKVKKVLLDKVDIVYDMGKRMGNKLQDYHKKFVGGKSGWREGF